jgi:hypothetical protein
MAEPTNPSYAGRTLVVLLCMHRSGSSLVANLLQRLGMSLGPFELLGATPSNKHGHFEAMPMYRLDQELMAQVFGFDEDLPRSPDVMRRFRECDACWSLETSPVSEEMFQQGRGLIEQLVASGQVSGFKDPRVPLLWPFWSRVFSGFAGLRVVPIVLARSPHEIAMSIFVRSQGVLAYNDALDVTAVHYQRLGGILDEWPGERAVVRFDSRVLADDLREAARMCRLDWNEEIFAQVYDASCKHHEPAAVAHRAEELFQRLNHLPTSDGAANLERLERDAATRENLLRGRFAEMEEEVRRLTSVVEQQNRQIGQLHETQTGNVEKIGQLEGELGLLKNELARITASRMWRFRKRLARIPGVRWLANSLSATRRKKV